MTELIDSFPSMPQERTHLSYLYPLGVSLQLPSSESKLVTAWVRGSYQPYWTSGSSFSHLLILSVVLFPVCPFLSCELTLSRLLAHFLSHLCSSKPWPTLSRIQAFLCLWFVPICFRRLLSNYSDPSSSSSSCTRNSPTPARPILEASMYFVN